MKLNNNSNCTVMDFYTASLLAAAHLPLVQIESRGGRSLLKYHFAASPQLCRDIITQHFDRTNRIAEVEITRAITKLIRQIQKLAIQEREALKEGGGK